jgi:hypothetical protein
MGIFENNATVRTIYVPMATVVDYRTASVWSNYESAIQGE